MNNITISNNIVEGQKNSGAVRVRMFQINVDNGDRKPKDVTFDIPLGGEEKINLTSPTTGFEVRPIVEGSAFASDEPVIKDIFGLQDSYDKLKASVANVAIIRGDMTLSEADKDARAGAAWAEAIRLAQS